MIIVFVQFAWGCVWLGVVIHADFVVTKRMPLKISCRLQISNPVHSTSNPPHVIWVGTTANSNDYRTCTRKDKTKKPVTAQPLIKLALDGGLWLWLRLWLTLTKLIEPQCMYHDPQNTSPSKLNKNYNHSRLVATIQAYCGNQA